MLNSVSKESRKSTHILIKVWFTMFSMQFVYLIICYFMLNEKSYKTLYSPEILKNTILYMNIDLYTNIYILSIIILIGGYLYYKKAYSKLVNDTQEKEFQNIEEEFKYFKSKYLNIMFTCLAIFEIIAVIGLIVFLTTLDFSTMAILIVITAIGFLLVIPSESKFIYSRI
ncbi:hypothetical protein [Arcobacter sp. LA11]|uniref:hypothetical protein n=1 Tax=Arcobacter sp. LA11 TaxID=1898176 RepID=UPI000933E5C0|nr:hypothetical protein [Arcobacter sp. LA11]